MDVLSPVRIASERNDERPQSFSILPLDYEVRIGHHK